MQCGPAASYPCSIMQCPKHFKSKLQFCMQIKIIIIPILIPKSLLLNCIPSILLWVSSPPLSSLSLSKKWRL